MTTNCKTCGVELKTMVSQGNGQCPSCEAKKRDSERAAERDVYARLDRLEEVVSVLAQRMLAPPAKTWKELTPELELLRAFLRRT